MKQRKAIGCNFNQGLISIKSMEHLISATLRAKISLLLFRSSNHSIFHQSSLESTVHAFNAIGIPQGFNVGFGFEDETTRILDSLKNGMSPAGNRFSHPIRCRHLVHNSGVVNQFRVSFFRNEIRVGPVLLVSINVSVG